MDLTVRGRGVRITEQMRAKAAHKLGRLSRLDPRAERVEVEIITERNPRLNGTKRLEGTLALPRHTVRARASASWSPPGPFAVNFGTPLTSTATPFSTVEKSESNARFIVSVRM